MHELPPLSVTEAADRSDVPKRTIQYAITKGNLKAYKMPGVTGAYLISPAELDRWLAGRAKATA